MISLRSALAVVLGALLLIAFGAVLAGDTRHAMHALFTALGLILARWERGDEPDDPSDPPAAPAAQAPAVAVLSLVPGSQRVACDNTGHHGD